MDAQEATGVLELGLSSWGEIDWRKEARKESQNQFGEDCACICD